MKSKRHQMILNIVENKIIDTQEELAEELRKAGLEVTQATVSRDIKELRLIKIPLGDNTYRYGLPNNAVAPRDLQRMQRMFSDSVININYSENIIVIKALPGTAQAVASAIDHLDDFNIIGTVAGDDTILVVIKPLEKVPEVYDKFTVLMQRRG